MNIIRILTLVTFICCMQEMQAQSPIDAIWPMVQIEEHAKSDFDDWLQDNRRKLGIPKKIKAKRLHLDLSQWFVENEAENRYYDFEYSKLLIILHSKPVFEAVLNYKNERKQRKLFLFQFNMNGDLLDHFDISSESTK